MLNLSYNNPYNVSVLAGHLCEDNVTIFNELFNYCEFTLIKQLMFAHNYYNIIIIMQQNVKFHLQT